MDIFLVPLGIWQNWRAWIFTRTCSVALFQTHWPTWSNWNTCMIFSPSIRMIAYYSSFLFYLVITVFYFYHETHFLPRSKKFMRNYVHRVFGNTLNTISHFRLYRYQTRTDLYFQIWFADIEALNLQDVFSYFLKFLLLKTKSVSTCTSI